MAKVKIYLEDGETTRDAEEAISKAFNHHNSGDIHTHNTFQDPAMQAIADKMQEDHAKMYHDMLQEINEVLDQDYSDYGN